MVGLLLGMVIVSVALGSNPCETKWFFSDREKGWFWKNLCVKKKEEERDKEKKDNEAAVPWEKLDEMMPSELKKLREKVLETAVKNPTYGNVLALKKLELYMLKKAEDFRKMWALVTISDPEVASYVSAHPTAEPARRVYLLTKEEEVKEKLESYKNRAGLLIAVRKTCPYCHELDRMIRTFFIPRTGWSVQYIDIDEKPGFARNMNVYAVPDIFLAVMGEKPFVVRIATGYVTYSELIERILMGLEVYEKGGLDNVEKVASGG